MEINGSVWFAGAGIGTLSNVAPATSTGEEGENKKGTLTFPNGIKIQWDTVDVPQDSSTSFSLPEAYTEANYTVIVCYADDSIPQTTGQSSPQGWVPTTSNLSQVRLRQIFNGTVACSYVSIGKDA